VETVQTEDLLALQDRLFAPIDARGKMRILKVVQVRSRTRRRRSVDLAA